MNEFEQRFFERLSSDELLDELVRENDVDLENILSTYVDDTWVIIVFVFHMSY